MSTRIVPTVDVLRGRIAEIRALHYKVAARADLHPSRLSQYLNGRVPCPDDVAIRIQEALDSIEVRRR